MPTATERPSASISDIMSRHEGAILTEWLTHQAAAVSRNGAISQDQLHDDSARFLRLLRDATRSGGSGGDLESKEWEPVRSVLAELSRTRAQKGFTPTETAMFVLSMKRPLFERLRHELRDDPQALVTATLGVSELLDRLGLYTAEVFQKTREEIIRRQQQEMLELSTPVIRLWDGILAVPLIGTLDSARTQVVMESLLQQIVEEAASIAIIDITGVPTVDTLVAQHLLKTVAAARLMGAECIISGIRPQIAQTIVHLGVALGDVTTKSSLADAFTVALTRMGLRVCRVADKS